ncbi:MAG: hypothetical protein IJA54_08800 [Tyzzerella sp.]|nr:hypothetical protein [Tyzzerella sp.]
MKSFEKKQCERLYEKHADDVYKVALYLTGNVDEAKDVVVKAFLNLYNNLDAVNPDYALGYLIHEVKSLITKKSDKTLLVEEAIEE